MKKLSVLGAVLLLSSCTGQYASTGEQLYLKSHNGPRLQVPPPLTRDNISDFYNLPPQTQNARVDIVPPR